MNTNLWPDFSINSIKTPKTILMEQAIYFNDKVNNILYAQVISGKTNDGKIAHAFNIIAPALGNFEYNLFNIYNEIIFYHLDFYYDNTVIEISNETELIEMLKSVFNNFKTIGITESLYSQSK